MTEEDKQKLITEFLTQMGITKALWVVEIQGAWQSYRHNLNHIELLGLAESIKADTHQHIYGVKLKKKEPIK